MRVSGLTRAVLAGALVALPMLSSSAFAAAAVGCLGPAQDVEITPSQASSLLKAALPAGVTLGAGSASDIMAAYTSAAGSNPGTYDDLGRLIAVARPDLVDSINGAVRAACSLAYAQDIINEIQDASANPTADELAAIAATDGVAPAAGPDAGGGDAGSGN